MQIYTFCILNSLDNFDTFFLKDLILFGKIQSGSTDSYTSYLFACI